MEEKRIGKSMWLREWVGDGAGERVAEDDVPSLRGNLKHSSPSMVQKARDSRFGSRAWATPFGNPTVRLPAHQNLAIVPGLPTCMYLMLTATKSCQPHPVAYASSSPRGCYYISVV